MTEFNYQTVTSRVDDDGVRLLLLNRPERLNAMNRQLIGDVTAAFNDANADAATRVIILSGAGSAFCAGDDRHEHQHPANREQAQAFVEMIQDATRAMVLGPKPIVGAINGWAVGGGLEWAINCDFPIWAASARGFFPEVSLNLFVTGGVSTLLPALAGLNRAREMLFLGERYDAQALLDMGVAWRVVDDDRLMAAAREVALRLARQPTRSLQAMKRVLGQTGSVEFERALQLETEATVDGFMDPLTTSLLKDF